MMDASRGGSTPVSAVLDRRLSGRRAWRALRGAGLALVALGCATTPAPVPAPLPSAPTPLAWRVWAPQPDAAPFTLLGSVHFGAGQAPRVGPAVEAAYRDAQELVVEVDLSSLAPAELAELTLRYGTVAPPRSLPDLLSSETHALLVAFLRERGLPEDSFDELEPWLVASTVAVMRLSDAGFVPEYGVDQSFLGAAAGSKPIVSLETAESQLAMLDGLSPEIQDLMLKDTLARGEPEAGAEDLLALWERGDEDALIAYLFGPLEEYPELAAFYDALFFARNETMSERLAELARDGRSRFVVLGAGHVVGPRGIPALLEAKGFRVERIGVGAPAGPAAN